MFTPDHYSLTRHPAARLAVILATSAAAVCHAAQPPQNPEPPPAPIPIRFQPATAAATSAVQTAQPPAPRVTDLIAANGPRVAIMRKLQAIKIAKMPGTFGADLEKGLPLSAVLRNLKAISITNDPHKVGIIFLFNPHRSRLGGDGAEDAAGAGVAGAAPVDADTIHIKINPALEDLTLLQLLDAICMVADQPINYSVEDYGVEFFAQPPNPVPMGGRTFHVDTNILWPPGN